MSFVESRIPAFAAIDRLAEALPGSVPPFVIRLLLAVVVLMLGWYASNLVVRVIGRSVARRIERPSITRSVLRGIRLIVMAVAIVVVGLILGVGNVEILLSVGVISAVVAVVLAPLIGSLINGLFILTDRPFEIGDMIEVADAGHVGFVEDITIRYTKIFTVENTFLVIPNAEIHERDVINYSAEDERTRLSISYEVTYESDLDVAIDAAERATRAVGGVITGGPPVRIGGARYTAAPDCAVRAFAENGVELVVRFWVERPYKQLAVRSAVLRRIRERYRDRGVDFAYPHRQVIIDSSADSRRIDSPDRTER